MEKKNENLLDETKESELKNLYRNNRNMDERNPGENEVGVYDGEGDEEAGGQSVWRKLQQNAANKKNSGGQKKPSSSTNNLVGSSFGTENRRPNKTGASSQQMNADEKKKTPMMAENRKNEPNYLQKNKEAIRNKENLSHRYLEKKYQILHGKNLGKNDTQRFVKSNFWNFWS